MSGGPIKAARDAWKPPKASTSDTDRVCMGTPVKGRGYCGRKATAGKVTREWADVNCSDCDAARRADLAVRGQG
jgi:hypothetical protein